MYEDNSGCECVSNLGCDTVTNYKNMCLDVHWAKVNITRKYADSPYYRVHGYEC
jgi:hypothetical protein